MSESASAGVIVHKRTSNFIDIEAPVSQSWIGCHKDGPKPGSNSLMMFYVLDGDTSYEFFYRRVYDVRMCLETEREHKQLIKNARTVRIVGIHPQEDAGPLAPAQDRVPRRFTAASKIISHVFMRLQANGRCLAYFKNDCDLPKNYWAGIIPE